MSSEMLREVRFRLPSHELADSIDTMHSSMNAVELTKLMDISDTIMREGMCEEEFCARLIRTMDLYNSIGPKDGAETMLVLQLLTSHNAAMELMRRASYPDQCDEAAHKMRNQAIRLMNNFNQGMAVLDSRRGSNKKTVVIEKHVPAPESTLTATTETLSEVADGIPLATLGKLQSVK